MLKKLVVPLLAHLLLLAAAVWMLLVLLQQSVFTGVLKWVMVGCAALLILCIAAAYLLRVLEQRGPASVRLCTLLDKPDRRVKPVEVHYSGFTIPDAFVVGYGLDYAEHYRNLPYIGILKPEVYGG